jgi:hypothetical protein
MVDHLRSVTPRSEIILEEVPAPQKLATFSFAFTADVSNGLLGDAEDEIASGRFVLLHEPGGQDTWEGDEAMQDDPLLPEVGWSWLLDSLSEAGCEFNAPSGTVTRVSSASFGKLSPRNDESEIEIRASWSPLIKDSNEMMAHVLAWCNLLGEVAGLPPVVEGVAPISAARRKA